MNGEASTDQTNIAANLEQVLERVCTAARAAGRDPSTVRVIAVSKTHGAERIRTAARAGQLDFGENRIQEALPKIRLLAADNLIWHFIGRLQTNKARQVPGIFHWLHTLDGLPLARKLSQHAVAAGVELQCLVQVNVTGDPAKGGVSPAAIAPLLEAVQEEGLVGVRMRGLMTIGPHGGNEVALRDCFGTLRRLANATRERFDLPDFDQLSMGMTTDLEAAIHEGATLVRVGSGIFGSR